MKEFAELIQSLAGVLGEDCCPTSFDRVKERDYVGLYNSLIDHVSLHRNKELRTACQTKTENEYCDDFYFNEFMRIGRDDDRYPEFIKDLNKEFRKTKVRTLERLLERIGKTSRHIKKNEAIAYLSYSTFYHDRTLKQHLAEFFLYHRSSGIKLICGEKHENAIDRLINEVIPQGKLRKNKPNSKSQKETKATPHQKTQASFTVSESEVRFLKLLREAKSAFYREVHSLTDKQIAIINKCKNDTYLWIEGDPGTGKTLIAIEAAYRTLSFGFDVLFVCYNGGFKKQLRQILGEQEKKLSIMDYEQFLMHLSYLELYHFNEPKEPLPNCEAIRLEQHGVETMEEYFKKFVVGCEYHKFDLVIFDDFSSSLTHLNSQTDFFLNRTKRITKKILFITSPVQNLSQLNMAIGSDKPTEPEHWKQCLLNNELDKFCLQKLEGTVRCSRAVTQHINKRLDFKIKSAHSLQGEAGKTSVSSKELEGVMLSIVGELLCQYSSKDIVIIVDPFLGKYPCFSGVEVTSSNCKISEKICELISEANHKSLWHHVQKGFEFSFNANVSPCSAIANPQEHRIKSAMPHTLYYQPKNESIGHDLTSVSPKLPFPSDHVFCTKIFEDDVLDKKFRESYIPVLTIDEMIGLESNVVIYIRSVFDKTYRIHQNDKIKSDSINETLLQNINKLHLSAMSRAKRKLIEIVVQP